jgi:hypothetical protein
MQNKMSDLNNHLFVQLERLNDEEISPDQLEMEIKRTSALVKVSTQIIENASVQLHAAKLIAEYGGDYTKALPETNNESSTLRAVNGKK